MSKIALWLINLNWLEAWHFSKNQEWAYDNCISACIVLLFFFHFLFFHYCLKFALFSGFMKVIYLFLFFNFYDLLHFQFCLCSIHSTFTVLLFIFFSCNFLHCFLLSEMNILVFSSLAHLFNHLKFCLINQIFLLDRYLIYSKFNDWFFYFLLIF